MTGINSKQHSKIFVIFFMILMCTFAILLFSSCSDGTVEEESSPAEEQVDENALNVTMTVEPKKVDADTYSFIIKTNLPDKTDLICMLYDDNDEFVTSALATIENGKAESESLYNNHQGFSGTYSLKISILPGEMPDSAMKIIGENYEHLTGRFTKESKDGKGRDFCAEFKVDLNAEKTMYDLDDAYEQGKDYFMSIKWNEVFPYGAKVHYIKDYHCKRSNDSERGYWEATASAKLTNEFGAKFNSYVKIYMNEKLEMVSCYYTDADGNDVEIK